MIRNLPAKQFLRLYKDGVSYFKTRYKPLVICDYTPTHKCINNNVQDLIIRCSSSNTRNQKAVLAETSPKIFINKDKISLQSILDPYLQLIRFDKPIGVWLLYWPCTWSIALASISNGVTPQTIVYNLSLFYAGSFVMRGAGCTINDLWDRDVDAKVERTKDRPLVSGALTEKRALIFLAGQLSLGLTILMQLNWLSVAIGASSLLLVVSYPLAKRITDFPQIVLGATFNWGAMLGYTAVANDFEPSVVAPLYAGALCWTVIYDTIYAHQDKNDDARIGIKSTALKFGDETKQYLSAFAAFGLGCFGAVGLGAGLEWPYYTALGLASAHVGRQIYSLDVDNPEDCATKFKSNALVGLIMLLGIAGGGYRQYLANCEARNAKG